MVSVVKHVWIELKNFHWCTYEQFKISWLACIASSFPERSFQCEVNGPTPAVAKVFTLWLAWQRTCTWQCHPVKHITAQRVHKYNSVHTNSAPWSHTTRCSYHTRVCMCSKKCCYVYRISRYNSSNMNSIFPESYEVHWWIVRLKIFYCFCHVIFYLKMSQNYFSGILFLIWLIHYQTWKKQTNTFFIC